VGGGSPDHVPGAEHVDPENPLPDFVRAGVEIMVRDGLGRAGVVYQDVEPCIALDGGLDELRGLGGVADVGLHVGGVGQCCGEALAC
jgi:hypothetical protein